MSSGYHSEGSGGDANAPIFCVQVALFLIQSKSLLVNKTYLMNKFSGKGCIRLSKGKHSGEGGGGWGGARVKGPKFVLLCINAFLLVKRNKTLIIFTHSQEMN